MTSVFRYKHFCVVILEQLSRNSSVFDTNLLNKMKDLYIDRFISKIHLIESTFDKKENPLMLM